MRAAVALCVLVATTAASAQEERRTALVVEYRAGVRAAPLVGERLARLLAATSSLHVIDPAEARRRRTTIDAEVARCAGDAGCTAGLGAELGADEVLLVGVSQLGDVIVALQRIDVRRRAAGARMAESLAPDQQLGDATLIGWLRQIFPPEVFRRFGVIRVVTETKNAEVLLNEEPKGRTPIDAMRVRAPARYQLVLRKNGFLPFSAGIDLLPDANVEVRAELQPASLPQPWWKRWYVWAAVGGAVAIAGASVAIYYGTRTDSTPQGFIQLPAPRM